MKVEILISTYNGEKYIKEQLDSLLSQSHGDYHITVRDDGSKDGTLNILRQYQTENPERIALIEDRQNLGYPDCFWTLLMHAPEADLYAFCDQDDVWDRDKLKCCAEKCGAFDPSVPILYVHDYQLCDGDLQVYQDHRIDDRLLSRESIYKTIYYVMAPGFSMVLNQALRQRIIRDALMKRSIPHDRWTLWCGMIAGTIVHDTRLLVKYRRHESTVTQTGKNNLIVLKEWWEEDVLGDRLAGWSRIAVYFADCYKVETDRIGSHCYAKWRSIAGADKGLIAYFKRLFTPVRLKPTFIGEMVLRICFLLNKK